MSCTHLQGQLPASSARSTVADLPPDLLPAIFRRLDHDSLFCALQVCRAWRAAGADSRTPGGLWEQQYAARGWQPAALRQRQRRPQQQAQQHLAALPAAAPAGQQGQGQTPQPQPQLPPPQLLDWREHYRRRYYECCYDCFKPTNRHTLLAGSLRLRLCLSCSSGYDSPRPHHRLLTGTEAKRQCCLKDAGEASCGEALGWLEQRYSSSCLIGLTLPTC